MAQTIIYLVSCAISSQRRECSFTILFLHQTFDMTDSFLIMRKFVWYCYRCFIMKQYLWWHIAHVLLLWYDDSKYCKTEKVFLNFSFLSKFYTKFPHFMIWLHDKANFSQQLYFLYLSSTVLYLQSFFLHSLHLARFLLLPTTASGLKTSILTTWDRPESTSQLESRQHCLSQNLMIYIAYLEDW